MFTLSITSEIWLVSQISMLKYYKNNFRPKTLFWKKGENMAVYIKNYSGLQQYLLDNDIKIIDEPTEEQIKNNLYFNFDYYDILKNDDQIQFYFGDTNDTFNTQTLRIRS